MTNDWNESMHEQNDEEMDMDASMPAVQASEQEDILVKEEDAETPRRRRRVIMNTRSENEKDTPVDPVGQLDHERRWDVPDEEREEAVHYDDAEDLRRKDEYARMFASWDLLPPQVVVRRVKR